MRVTRRDTRGESQCVSRVPGVQEVVSKQGWIDSLNLSATRPGFSI